MNNISFYHYGLNGGRSRHFLLRLCRGKVVGGARKWISHVCVLIFYLQPIAAKGTFSPADSIMNQVFNHAKIHGEYIREYNAKAYIKGNIQVIKKNFLYRFAPDFLYMDKKNNNSLLETLVDIRYVAPNHFTERINAINSAGWKLDDLQKRVIQFLNINIYNPTSFSDEVLMPMAKNAFKYYHFDHVSTQDTLDHKIFKIKVTPRIKSQKLITGYLYIVDRIWTVIRIDIQGKWEFSEFRVETNFGLPENDFLLPLETNLTLRNKLLGNEVVTHYSSIFKYGTVKKYEKEDERKTIKYDQSEYFNVRLDSLPIVKDSLFWEENRPTPLTKEEQVFYESQKQPMAFSDTLDLLDKKSWNFAKGLIIPKRFEYNATQFRYSGLLNPLKFAYSKLDGIVYWQQLKLNKTFESGKEIFFRPDVGFVFERKEVYFNMPLSWLFQPSKLGQAEFSLGNRNHSYSSKTIDLINEEIPDSIDFDDLKLEYFNHFYFALQGQYELNNGLLFQLGTDYHLYKPVQSEDALQLRQEVDDDVIDIVENQYKSFTPFWGVTWTPGQYYRINGKRKEYLSSYFPTFSFEYARGIPGILGSNSHYERMEVDILQRIPLGLLRSIQYYAGAGQFTNTESVYFADFKKFRKRNFPRSWNDPIGGVFHLLDGNWYNASDLYIQAHAMYESPFVFLQLCRGVTKDILKERIYLSQLYIPVLPSYTEIGYGVGNYLFNIGIFFSLVKGKYDSFGFKFAFELGR